MLAQRTPAAGVFPDMHNRERRRRRPSGVRFPVMRSDAHRRKISLVNWARYFATESLGNRREQFDNFRMAR
jgi:hypothetical protein